MQNLQAFIAKYVTQWERSMFLDDLGRNTTLLSAAIEGRSVLVIGGAGSIGAATIKVLLPYCPQSLVVVDVNENEVAA